jgi:hypothetical protein
VQAIHAVVCDVHDEALFGQALAQVGGQLELVFDYQKPHGRAVPCGRARVHDEVVMCATA